MNYIFSSFGYSEFYDLQCLYIDGLVCGRISALASLALSKNELAEFR
jgi:hypothetical protein